MQTSPRQTTTNDHPQCNQFSSSRCRARSAVNGDGEAQSLLASADRDLLLARCEIAEAHYRGGDSLAIAMLASSSLRLYGSVVAGDLSEADLFDGLQECADNLGITARAPDRVEHAISFGPRRYAEAA